MNPNLREVNQITPPPEPREEDAPLPPTPKLPKTEKTRAHELLTQILKNPNKKQNIEALTEIIDGISEVSPSGNGGGKGKGTLISIIILFVLTLGDFASGYFKPTDDKVLEQIAEVSVQITAQKEEVVAKLIQIETRFETLETRLETLEVNLAKSTLTDEQLSEALGDYIDSEGHKLEDLPDSVRLVMLKNEQKKLEDKMSK